MSGGVHDTRVVRVRLSHFRSFFLIGQGRLRMHRGGRPTTYLGRKPLVGGTFVPDKRTKEETPLKRGGVEDFNPYVSQVRSRVN